MGAEKVKKEEAEKKSKSNSTKSATEEQNNRKERKIEPLIRYQQAEMKSTTWNARNQKPIPRTSLGRSSAGAAPQTSLKRVSSLSDKSEQGNNKKQKQSDTQKNLIPNSPKSVSR